jgi:hypothetical protein
MGSPGYEVKSESETGVSFLVIWLQFFTAHTTIQSGSDFSYIVAVAQTLEEITTDWKWLEEILVPTLGIYMALASNHYLLYSCSVRDIR